MSVRKPTTAILAVIEFLSQPMSRLPVDGGVDGLSIF